MLLRLEFFEICREVAEEVKFFETAAFEVFREDEVAELKLAPFTVFYTDPKIDTFKIFSNRPSNTFTVAIAFFSTTQAFNLNCLLIFSGNVDEEEGPESSFSFLTHFPILISRYFFSKTGLVGPIWSFKPDPVLASIYEVSFI